MVYRDRRNVPGQTPENAPRSRQPAVRRLIQGLRYRPQHQCLLPLNQTPLAPPGSTVRFYAHDRGRPVQAQRPRSQRAISPDYTIGWLTNLFIVVNGDAGFIAGSFNTQYTHDLFYLALLPRSVGPMRVDVKLCSPPEKASCILLTLIKVPFKKAAVLYKAAAIAVKFRTILK